jgi:hypothetical protein
VKLPSWALAPLLVVSIATAPARAAVRAWLDSSDVAPGDTIELTLEYEGQPSGQPELAPLQRDFEILDSNTSTRIQIVNGLASARTQVIVSLSPRHAGRLTVPAISWDGERSAPLALNVLNVGPAGRGAAGNSRQVFLETEVDPKQPYVQAAVRMTLRLYTREALYRPSITFESGPAAVVRQVGSDEEGSVERGGVAYEVVTRHYLLFPQHSGSLNLAGPVLNAQIPSRRGNSFGNDPFAGAFGASPLVNPFLAATSKPIRVQGDPIALNVLARPPAAASGYWLPARELTLESTWRPSALQAHVGDPVTLDLSLQAEGLTAAQLPDLTQLLELPTGVRAYPDAPKLNDVTSGDSIIGTRTQSIAFIAGQPGRFTVPALHVRWWDTRSNQEREATLPQRVLVVLPAAGLDAAASAAAGAARAMPAAKPGAPVQAGSPHRLAPAGTSSGPARQSAGAARHFPWLWVSAALAFAWAVTLAAWLRLRRRMAAAVPPAARTPAARTTESARNELSEARSRSAFRLACTRHDAPAARRHLLAWVRSAWARAGWPGPAPAGLNAFARQVDEPHVARLIRELDRACYAGEHWRGEVLAAALPELPVPQADAAGRASARALAPLYPQIDAAREGYV